MGMANREMDKGRPKCWTPSRQSGAFWCRGEMMTKLHWNNLFPSNCKTSDFHILVLLDQEWIREEKPFGSQEGGVQCPLSTNESLYMTAISEKLS
jgi:hypothetical protein